MKLSVQHVDGMRFLATVGQPAVAVDAAPEDGGIGTAPSAPQLFAAAVGACVLEYVANSCRLRGVPFRRLSLEMACQQVASPRRVGAMEVTISIEPEPTEEVKGRLIRVARRASLVNTLERPPDVVVRFAGE
jgi:uncharacterized OsmC-like protein